MTTLLYRLAIWFCLLACSSSLFSQIDATSSLTSAPGQSAFVKTRLGGFDAVTGRGAFSLPLGPRLPGRIPAGFVLTFDGAMGPGTFRPVFWRLGNATDSATTAISNTVTLFGRETVFHVPASGTVLPSQSTLDTWMADRKVDYGKSAADKEVARISALYGNRIVSPPVATMVKDHFQTTTDGTKFLTWFHWHIAYSISSSSPKGSEEVFQSEDLPVQGVIIDGDFGITQVDKVTTITTRWGDKVTVTESDIATDTSGSSGSFVIQDANHPLYTITLTIVAAPTTTVNDGDGSHKVPGAATLHVVNALGSETAPAVDVTGTYRASETVVFTGSTTWLGTFHPASFKETASDGTNRTTVIDSGVYSPSGPNQVKSITYPDGFVEKFFSWVGSSWVDNSWSRVSGLWQGAAYPGAASQPLNRGFSGVDRVLSGGGGQSVRVWAKVPTGSLNKDTTPYTWAWNSWKHSTSIFTFDAPTSGGDLSGNYRLVRLTHVNMPTSNMGDTTAFLACTSAVVQEEHLHGKGVGSDGTPSSPVTDQVIQYSGWDLTSWANPSGTPGLPTTAVATRTTVYSTDLPARVTLAGDLSQGGRDAYGPVRTDSQTLAPTSPTLRDGSEAPVMNTAGTNPSLAGSNLRTAVITRSFHPVAARLVTLTEQKTLDGTDLGTTTSAYDPTTGLLASVTGQRGGYTSLASYYCEEAGQPMVTKITRTLSGPDIATGLDQGTSYAYGPAPSHALTTETDLVDGRPVTYVPDDLGRTVGKTDVLGHASSFVFDPWGRLKTETQNVGTAPVVTDHTYDVNGTWWEEKVTPSDGHPLTKHTDLDGFGHAVSVTTKDQAGNTLTTQTFSFDGFGQLKTQSPVLTGTQASWGNESWTYDGQGQPYEHLDAQGRPLSKVTQQPKWMYEAASGVTGVVTTVLGAAVPTISGDQRYSRTEVHDLLGRKVAVVDQMGQVARFSYDSDGHLTGTNQGGQLRSYQFNAIGFLTSRTEPEEGTTVFANFTQQGVPLYTRRKGLDSTGNAVTTTVLDGQQRPHLVTTTDGATSVADTLNYDPTTRLLSDMQSVQPFGTLIEIYGYDPLHRVNSKIVTDGIQSFTVKRTMDSVGNVTSLTYPSGGGRSAQQVTTALDAQNRPSTVSLDLAQRAQMDPDHVSGTAVSDILFFNNNRNMNTTWLRDKGELTSVTHQVVSGLTGNVQANAMAWSAGGLLRSRGGDSFWYDSLQRLSQCTILGLSSGESITQSFGYDGYGNRSSNSFSYTAGSGGTQPDEVVIWSAPYDAAHPNQIPSVITRSGSQLITGSVYDNQGRITEILAVPGKTGYATSWQYDAASRVISETVNGAAATFLLDGAGLRFKRNASDGSTLYTVYGFNREPLALFKNTPQVVTSALAATSTAKASTLATKAKLSGTVSTNAMNLDPAGAWITSPVAGTTVHVGDTISFVGGTDYGETFVWNFQDGTTATTLTALKAYTTAGTYAVSFTAKAPYCRNRAASVTVTVLAAVPVISSFSTSSATLPLGGSATLSWSVSNATTLSLDNGIGTVTGASSIVVTPAASCTYTLTATSAGGTVSRQVSVVVVQPPVISAFSASPSSIYQGDGSTLSWSASGATSLVLDNGIGSVTGSSSRAVSPTTSTTYTLTATNTVNGVSISRTAAATVGVSPRPTVPSIQSFTADATTLATGTATTLRWTVVNSVGTVAVTLNGASVSSSASQGTGTLTSTITYTLTAVNTLDTSKSVSANITITVIQPPQISLSANPGAVNAGSGSTLTWNVANGPTSVSLDQGIGGVAAAGTLAVTPAATTTYTLTASNLAGTVTASTTVTVTQKPVITSFTAGASQINQGSGTTLTWTVQGATSLSVNGASVTGTTLVVAPTKTTTYTLTATNSAGSASAAATITVVIPASFVWTKSMVYGFGQLLSEETASGTIYIQSDQVGSPNIMMDSAGTVVGRTKNLPFGERFGSWGTQSQRRYTNHEDQVGSAIYMQARMYLPAYGKFAQPDPAYDQTKGDPETWNLFSYVTNNPVTHTDPDGRMQLQVDGVFAPYGFGSFNNPGEIDHVYNIGELIAKTSSADSSQLMKTSLDKSIYADLPGGGKTAEGKTPAQTGQGGQTSYAWEKKNADGGYLNVSNPGTTPATPMVDDKGNPVIGASGLPALMPVGTSIQAFATKGAECLSISPFLPTAMLYNFKIGGSLDLQRLSGSFDGRFTDAATIAIGVFSASGGVPFKTVMGIMDGYAARNSHFGNVQMDTTYTHLPATNVMNTRIGFGLVESGRVSPASIPQTPQMPVF